MRVLVVDDTTSVRERIAAMISGLAGVEVVEQAVDGVSGLACIATRVPDVLVLDIRMPRMNGFQLLDAIKHRTARPVSIVVSNHAEYRRHALLAGASFFYDKSTQIDDLLATLVALASRRMTAT